MSPSSTSEYGSGSLSGGALAGIILGAMGFIVVFIGLILLMAYHRFKKAHSADSEVSTQILLGSSLQHDHPQPPPPPYLPEFLPEARLPSYSQNDYPKD
jgi:hypothetical protein